MSITLTPASPVVAGSSVRARATFTWTGAAPNGTVNYSYHPNGSCTGTGTAAGTEVVVTAGTAGQSTAVTFSTAGTFSWKAVFTEGASQTTACATLVVSKTSPTVSLTISPTSIQVGGTATETATISSAATANASGTVVYTTYMDVGCTTAAATPAAVSRTVTNRSVANSGALTFNEAGTRYVRAVYSGDANNNGANSPCGALVVNKRSPTVSLVISPTSMTVGETLTGTATISDAATTNAGGTVVYTTFTDAGCMTAAATPAAVSRTVTNRSVANSGALTFNEAGTRYVRATYSGDANNNGANSPCEALVVNKTSPTVSLTISPTSIQVGGTVTGTATISSAATTNAGGTVVYATFTDAGCMTAAATPAAVSRTVTNRSVANSGALTFNEAGTRYVRATYSGDTNNNGANSSCLAVTIAKKTTTLSLTVSPTTVTTAAPTTGTATLTGGVSAPGGTVTYTVYTNSSCTTAFSPPRSSIKSVTNGVVPQSDGLIIPTVGERYVRAAYSGDANNLASTSGCVEVTVNKASPTLSLSVSPNPVAVGSTATASATLNGASSNATGSVTYRLYTNSGCTTQVSPAQSNMGTVTNGVAAPSAPFTFSAPGTFYVGATYSGGPNNNRTTIVCVPIVAKFFPALSLTVNPATINAGASASGAATLTGASSSAGGTVTYTVYGDASCTIQTSPVRTSTKTVSNAVAPNSDSFTFALAGTYYWKAAYTGDTNNAAANSGCSALVVKASPSLALGVSPNPVIVGATASGSATLSGATGNASGSVTYATYTNSGCTVEISPSQASTKTVTNGTVPASTPATFTRAGTFFWKATYSGDPTNNATASSCAALTVNPASPLLALGVSPNPVIVGATASGSATLSGATGNASGSVAYAIYTNSGCTVEISPSQASTKTVTNGTVPASTPATFTQAGTFYWKATYTGDASNNAASSACVAGTVNQATPTLGMTQNPAAVATGGSFSYSFALSSSSGQPSGTVTLRLYSNSGCGTMLPRQTYTMTLSGGTIPDSPAITYTFPGQTWARAVYTGDAGNATAMTACQQVSVIVGPLTASISDAVLPSVAYANGPQSNGGQLTLAVADQRGMAEGWAVSVSAGAFAYSGPSLAGSAIPASGFVLTGAGSLAVVSGQPIGAGGPMAGGGSGSLDQSRTVMVAQPGFGAGSYDQVLSVSLDIPPQSQVGTYTADLVVDTTAAP